MTRQNRVTPTGQIIATPARGMFMGNRGILHNAQGEITQPYATKLWIICQLSSKGRRRKLMQPGKYTELFFLDEATALAAGHRPCFECRREAALSFRQAWLAGNPQLNLGELVGSGEIDAVLHAERLTGGYYKKDKRQKTHTAVLHSLPNGTFIWREERPYLVWADALLPWMAEGYGKPVQRAGSELVTVLTPASTVAALAHGYQPQLHPSALGGLGPGGG